MKKKVGKDLTKEKIYKSFLSETEFKEEDSEKRLLIAKISDPLPDRSKDRVIQNGVVLDNFVGKNAPVLWAHKYDQKPIGKCVSIKVSDDGILASVEFTPKGLNPEADMIYEMYKQKFLNAWSIGFMPLEYEVNKDGGYDFTSWELFEFSSVPVPDNPRALTVMRSKGLNVDEAFENMRGKELPEDFEMEEIEETIEEKGVIGYKETPKAPEDETWDGSAEVKKATVEDLKIMCAWYDSDKPDVKGSYKLPHHKADGDHAVVWNGVKAAGAAVQGARDGLDVPDSDLAGIKSHLEKHYHQFDKKAPWEDEGKAVDEETTETKTTISPELQETAEEAAKKEANDLSTDAPISSLTVGQLKDLLADGIKGVCVDKSQETVDTEAKSVDGAVKKDVQEVLMLGDVLSALSWVIWVFEGGWGDPDDDDNKVSQSSIDKLNQALGLVLQVVQEQAVLGEKSFKLSDIPKGKEVIKIVAKAGRTISSKHEDMLNSAVDYMSKGVEQVKGVLDSIGKADAESDGEKSGEDHDSLERIANAIATNNRKTDSVAKKQNETLSHLEQIANLLGKGVKEHERK